jgi:hypothetical protein
MARPTTTLQRLLRWSGLGLLVLLTGCLTIEENYAFKKDGSGSMEYVVDLSAFGELMKSMEEMGGGKDKGKDGMGEMDMKDDAKAIGDIPGIKKVKIKREKEGFIQRLSFRFKDITALNAALNVLMPDSTGAKTEFFRWEGNTLVRVNNRHASELGGDMAEDPENDSLNMTGMLQSMQYKYSFKFADAVASTELREGMVKEAPSTKQVDLSTDWSVIMKDPEVLDLRITLDK